VEILKNTRACMPLHTASALLPSFAGDDEDPAAGRERAAWPSSGWLRMSDDEKSTTEAPRKKKRSKLWLLAPAVLLLAGVPAGAYVWMHRGAAAGSGGAEAPKPDHSGVLPLDPFTVNLADKDSPRFLRVTMQLVIEDGEAIEDLKKNALKLARLRSDLLEFLAQQVSEHLVSPDGKTELKRAIAQRASAVLQPLKVTDVFLSDFVVQF
jgi:flagellar basal body-associated protein FliL